jgi:transcriptional regulator with XRE-family HTH domain
MYGTTGAKKKECYMTQSVLAETLRVLRARRGVGFVEAAEGMGVDRHTLRRLERGQGNPSYATLHKAAEYYGVTPQSLLVLVGEEGETEPPKAPAPTSPQLGAEEPGEERRPNLPSGVGTRYEQLWTRDPEAFHRMAREVFQAMARLRRNIEALDVPAENRESLHENLESLETRARELVDQVA